MQIHTDIESVQPVGPTALTIGNFDGVHRGHQALLRTLIEVARTSQAGEVQTALVTFEPHPLKVLRPELPLHLLTTPLERMQIAAGLGIDIGLIQPFTAELSRLEAHEFLTLLKTHLNMVALVVGPDFALGHNRSGDLDTLAELGNELDYELIVQEHITWGERSVRSRTVRELLEEGNVAEAATLLGRLYHMSGEVQRGDQRGRQIGIPTANLAVREDKLWPANGVYVTRTWIMGAKAQGFPSVTNVGVRPTVNGHTRRLETHLLDFPGENASGDLYGAEVVVEFVEHLRGEQRFDSLDELVAQIYRDIARAREILHDAQLPDKPFFTTPVSVSPPAE